MGRVGLAVALTVVVGVSGLIILPLFLHPGYQLPPMLPALPFGHA